MNKTVAKPDWLKVRLGHGPAYARMNTLMKQLDLHTVCREAQCPNLGFCWEHGRATVMILGDACTRRCRFCGVGQRTAAPVDPDEPRRVAEAVARMGVRDIVLTSVTRDDLADGGAAPWAETIRRVREAAMPDTVVEALVPDFKGDPDSLDQVARAGPDVFGHNMETVADLYAQVRAQADYARSLNVLRRARRHGLIVKTGVMVGLGETLDQLETLIEDVADAGCEILTLGQYLQPSADQWPVARYVEPSEFEQYSAMARARGLAVVLSGPLVRSSYHSKEQSEYVRQRRAETRRRLQNEERKSTDGDD